MKEAILIIAAALTIGVGAIAGNEASWICRTQRSFRRATGLLARCAKAGLRVAGDVLICHRERAMSRLREFIRLYRIYRRINNPSTPHATPGSCRADDKNAASPSNARSPRAWIRAREARDWLPGRHPSQKKETP